MSLVTSDWLENNLSDVKIIDCSWHMPGIDRNPKEEYSKNHIPGAIFFDLDKNSNQDTDLPHMLPAKEKWEEIVSSMGISNTDRIIIYDNYDVLSACRGWYNFIYFGHDKHLVSVLNGGLKKWLEEKRKVTNNLSKVMKSDYKSFENQELVKNKDSINQNIETQNFRVIDARSKERFEGRVPEPREGLKSGNIKNSVCIPFGSCLNQDRTFRNKQELEKIFQSSLKNLNDKNIVFSCGSGVTACVLALAYSLINDKYRPCIYDGSWAEYGLI